jgi:methionyl-tRNA formyltransferase
MKDIRVVFMGTPSFGVPVLEALIEMCNVVGVVTQPDSENNYSPIKQIALKHNIAVVQPEKIKTDFYQVIDLKPDIVITCAYGQIIPNEILDYPKYGCINVHASLLPKLRGGAPIHKAIIEGYSKTGITIMYMAPKMDAGDIIRQAETIIEDTDNAGTLHDRLSIMGRDLLIDTLPDIISGNIERIKQNEEEVTYAWNLKREDERIDFEKGKRTIFNRIRGLCPWPGAYSIFEGKILKVWNSRIGDNYYSTEVNGQIVKIYDDGIGIKVQDGEIIFTEIQLEGKRKMKVKEFLNGIQNKDGLIGRVLE